MRTLDTLQRFQHSVLFHRKGGLRAQLSNAQVHSERLNDVAGERRVVCLNCYLSACVRPDTMHFVVSHSAKPHLDASGVRTTLRHLQFFVQDETLVQPNGDALRSFRDLFNGLHISTNHRIRIDQIIARIRIPSWLTSATTPLLDNSPGICSGFGMNSYMQNLGNCRVTSKTYRVPESDQSLLEYMITAVWLRLCDYGNKRIPATSR